MKNKQRRLPGNLQKSDTKKSAILTNKRNKGIINRKKIFHGRKI